MPLRSTLALRLYCATQMLLMTQAGLTRPKSLRLQARDKTRSQLWPEDEISFVSRKRRRKQATLLLVLEV